MATRSDDPRDPHDPNITPVPLPRLDLEQFETDNIDQVLHRADALLTRNNRVPNEAQPNKPAPAAGAPTEFPVLTEVVPAPRKPPTAQDLMLDEIEDELRLELLGQMGPELERSIESRVHSRLESNMEAIMARTQEQLVTEVRRAVREALDQVIGEEIKRLRKETSGRKQP